MYSTYRLRDQRFEGIQSIRYVGITEDVYARFYQHLRGDENIEKNLWIQDLKNSNTMLIMEIIEEKETFDEARENESFWIRHYLAKGCQLLNVQITSAFTFEKFTSFFSPDEKPAQRRNLRSVRAENEFRRPLYISFPDAVLLSGYSGEYLTRLVSAGKIQTKKNSKKVLLRKSVDLYLASHKPKVEEELEETFITTSEQEIVPFQVEAEAILEEVLGQE